MNPSSRPKQRAGYRLEHLDDELLLYHLDETKILYCNQTASLVWRLCDGRRTVQEIVTLLSEAFPESVEAIAADVDVTLEQFMEQGSIELS